MLKARALLLRCCSMRRMIMSDAERLATVRKAIDVFKDETSRTGVDAIHAVHDIAIALGVELYPRDPPEDP